MNISLLPRTVMLVCAILCTMSVFPYTFSSAAFAQCVGCPIPETTYIDVTVPISGKSDVCQGNALELSVDDPKLQYEYAWFKLSADGKREYIGKGKKISVSPNENTTYAIEYTQSTTSSYYFSTVYTYKGTKAVTVMTAPPLVVEDLQVCEGSTATAHIYNAQPDDYDYTWVYNGAVVAQGASYTFIAMQSMQIEVSAYELGHCIAIDYSNIEVENLPNIVLPATSVTIAQGESYSTQVQNANTAISYTWKDDKGNSVAQGASVTLSPTRTTTYTVTAVSPFGCSAAKELSVVVQPPLHAVFRVDHDIPGDVGKMLTIPVYAKINEPLRTDIDIVLGVKPQVLDISGSIIEGEKRLITLHCANVLLEATEQKLISVEALALLQMVNTTPVEIISVSLSNGDNVSIEKLDGSVVIGGSCVDFNVHLASTSMALSPMPVHSELTVKLSHAEAGKHVLSVYDEKGERLFSRSLEIASTGKEAEQEIQLPTDTWHSGSYTLVLQSPLSQQRTRFMIVR